MGGEPICVYYANKLLSSLPFGSFLAFFEDYRFGSIGNSCQKVFLTSPRNSSIHQFDVKRASWRKRWIPERQSTNQIYDLVLWRRRAQEWGDMHTQKGWENRGLFSHRDRSFSLILVSAKHCIHNRLSLQRQAAKYLAIFSNNIILKRHMTPRD